ncbi:MAG: cobalamin B12-binding domain-containing protein [Nitrospiria bacterium]
MTEFDDLPPVARRRILLAKIGLDGHDRGIKVVARALRDAGMDVVYLGLHNTPAEIVASAIQEDVDAIGLSIHSAAHMTLFEEVLKRLKKEKAEDIPVFGGGIVPDEDITALQEMGIRAIFTPGTPMDDIVAFVREMVGGE